MANVVVIACASSGHAATAVWTGPVTGGLFNDGANWNSPSPPGTNADDLAIFNASTNVNGTITFSDSVLLRDAHFRNTSGTINLNVGTGNSYTMTRNVVFGAAAGEVNTIIASSGHFQSGLLLLGNVAGSNGNSLTVTGDDTSWNAAGTGTSASLRVGSNGGSNTSLTIAEGASVSCATLMIIGLQSASNNTATVTGLGSELSVVNSLSLGDNIAAGLPAQTNNQLKVLDSGYVTVRELIIGTTENSPSNTVTVSGSGSRLNVRGGQQSPPTEVGQNNDVGRSSTNNKLIVESGGVVDGGAIFMLGRNPSSTGNLLSISDGSLTGTGIKLLRGKLLIDNGSVEINRVLDGIVNIILGGMLLAELPTAEIEFRSGVLATPSATITNGSVFLVGDGGSEPAVYRMKPDIGGDQPRGSGANIVTHTFTGGLHLNANGVLEGDGDVVGNVSGAAGALVNVGASPGIINVSGNWNNTGVEIALELDDLSTAQVAGEQYDLLDITGAFTHGGAVSIDLSQYEGPASPEQLKLIGWSSQVGLSSATTVSFTGGSPLAFSFQADGLYVTAVPGGLPGDHSFDRTVDAADYVAWRKNSINGPQGYADFVKHFGEPGGGGALSERSVVPEPTTWAIGMGLTVFGWAYRRAGGH